MSNETGQAVTLCVARPFGFGGVCVPCAHVPCLQGLELLLRAELVGLERGQVGFGRLLGGWVGLGAGKEGEGRTMFRRLREAVI